MTEKNIETLIGFAYMAIVMYIVYNFMYKAYATNNNPRIIKEIPTVTTEKTIWDKLKIASLAISAIAALLFSIFKLIELFMDKKQ